MLSEARHHLLGRIALATVAAGAALSLSACGLPLLPPALSGGSEEPVPVPEPETEEPVETEEPEPIEVETEEPTGAGSRDVDVMDVTVGDCFFEDEMNTALGSDAVNSIPVVECTDPHDAEVFHVEDLPAGDFPGETSVQSSMEDICTGTAFESFIGVDYQVSSIYVGGLKPTEQTWDQLDDREILCYAISDTGSTSESLEGANR